MVSAGCYMLQECPSKFALQHPFRLTLNTFPITWGLRARVGETGQHSYTNPMFLSFHMSFLLPLHTTKEHQDLSFPMGLSCGVWVPHSLHPR